MRALIEQGIFSQRSGGDEPHHIAAHDGLGAAFAGLCRVLELLTDGDPVTLFDEPLQVLVRTHDGDAAHRDVLTEVLAALGQHDAEGLRGGDGILEEELVEITHPVPEQAVRIGLLDFEILRHRGRRLRGSALAVTGAGVRRGFLGGRR